MIAGAAGAATSVEQQRRGIRTFCEILELFRKHDVRLVVNSLPEAPYVQRSSPARRRHQQFLDGPVRGKVESLGFVWIRPDTRELADEDFFDHNHLNDRGIARYTPLFVDLSSGPRPETVTFGQAAAIAVIASGWAMQFASLRRDPLDSLEKLPVAVKCLGYAALAAAVIVFGSEGPRAFLYFQF